LPGRRGPREGSHAEEYGHGIVASTWRERGAHHKARAREAGDSRLMAEPAL